MVPVGRVPSWAAASTPRERSETTTRPLWPRSAAKPLAKRRPPTATGEFGQGGQRFGGTSEPPDQFGEGYRAYGLGARQAQLVMVSLLRKRVGQAAVLESPMRGSSPFNSRLMLGICRT